MSKDRQDIGQLKEENRNLEAMAAAQPEERLKEEMEAKLERNERTIAAAESGNE